MNNKTVHQAVEIEKLLLGYILQYKTMQNIFGLLGKDDFFDQKHVLLYDALCHLADQYQDKHIEQSIVIQYLSDNKLLEKVGGASYLGELISNAGLEANVQKYIRQIEEKSRLRRLAKDFEEIQRDLSTGTNLSTDEVIEKAELKILSSIRNTDVKGFENVKTISEHAMNIINDKIAGKVASGVKSDYIDLDTMTGGFQKGDLIILAARPSMGKTALAINIATNVARKGRVAFFSIEMPSNQIMNRIFSSEGMIDANKLRDPKLLTPMDHNKLASVVDQINKLHFEIDDTAGIKITDLVWKAKSIHKNAPLSLIVIDYLQLISSSVSNGVDNRQAEVSQISRTLKKLARELNVPVIALSQLSRKVEQRESKVPMMSDLRESGAIEQDADVVAFVYREDYYKREEDKTPLGNTQKVEIIIGKHRNGATGTVFLAFEPRFGLFTNIKREKK